MDDDKQHKSKEGEAPAPIESRALVMNIGLVLVVIGIIILIAPAVGSGFSGLGDVFGDGSSNKSLSARVPPVITPHSQLDSLKIGRTQLMLAQLPDMYPEGIVSGNYGELTEAAVSRFQESRGLPVTGVIDPATYQALEQEVGLRVPGTTDYKLHGVWNMIWKSARENGVTSVGLIQENSTAGFVGVAEVIETSGLMSSWNEWTIYGAVDGTDIAMLGTNDRDHEWYCYYDAVIENEALIKGTWECPQGGGTFTMVPKD